MDTYKKFSIIIATYNCVDTISLCLNSIKSQVYRDFEVIVIDGFSNDGTKEFLENVSGIDYYLSEPDSGIYDAWNKALRVASGEWVYFLGADDQMASDQVLMLVANYLKEIDSSTIKIIYGGVEKIDFDGNSLGIEGDQPWSVLGNNFFEVMTLEHQGVFHHISLFNKLGFFDTRFVYAGDYEFLQRVVNIFPPMFIASVIIAKMRIGGSGSPISDFGKMFRVLHECRLASKINGAKKVPFRWIISLIKAYARFWGSCLWGDYATRCLCDQYRCFMGRSPIWVKGK